MKRIKTHSTPGQHAARLWKAFFACLSKAGYVAGTENYVSTFSTQFNLKPAEYRLGDRTVML